MLEQINWHGNAGGLDLHCAIDQIPNVFPLQWSRSDLYHEAGRKRMKLNVARTELGLPHAGFF